MNYAERVQNAARPSFISYSHEDTKWREDLEKNLKPYLRDGSITSWSDEEIKPGSQWFEEIKSALTNTKVAVLLVTPDFLASDFIHEYELGPLLKEAEQGGVTILWVPIYESAYKQTALKNYQALLDPGKPLGGMTVSVSPNPPDFDVSFAGLFFEDVRLHRLARAFRRGPRPSC